MKFIDLSGHVFGRLTVQYRIANRGKHTIWACFCQCGNAVNVSSTHLRSGHTLSCGCYRDDAKRNNKHGEIHGMCETPEYDAWHKMKGRCLNENDRKYPDYGGRGITVCQEWIDSFEKFYSHIGKRPSEKHSLDRIENNKGYAPVNVRWATIVEQNNNRRNSKKARAK